MEQVKTPFTIGTFKDEVTCDIVPMSIDHVLLGRPWKFDQNFLYNRLANTYSVSKDGKQVQLMPLNPSQVLQDQLVVVKATKDSLFANKGEVKCTLISNEIVYLLIAKEISSEEEAVHPKLKKTLKEFLDVFPKEVPNKLPPI